jgi:hypothetical protein
MSLYDPTDPSTGLTIPLNNDKLAIVDAEDHRWLSLFRWKAYSNGTCWYAKAYIPSRVKEVPMHKVVMWASDDQLLDHKNNNGLDNRKSNLRFCTASQNMMNRPGHGKTSRYKGVSWDKVAQKWKANICREGRSVHIGHFEDEDEAALAYNAAAIGTHGEFAWLNMVPPTDQNFKYKKQCGRKPKVHYRPERDTWYTQIKQKQYILARGLNGKTTAEKNLTRLLSDKGLIY